MRNLILVLAVLVALSGEGSEVDVLARELLDLRGPSEDEEAAAFLVRKDGGPLQLVPWPMTRAFRKADWNGPLPAGLVGVIHTHPWKLPRPSVQDVSEAIRLRLPFYVISRSALCMAAPNGKVTCGRTTGGVPGT